MMNFESDPMRQAADGRSDPIHRLGSDGTELDAGDYGSIYGDLYARFPQEKQTVGLSALTMLKVDQASHQTKDPAIEDIVLRLVSDGALATSRVDCGDGCRTLSGRPGSFYLAPANAIADWHADGDHQLLLLALPRGRAVSLLAGGDPDGADPLDALYGRELFDASVAQLMERIWQESQRNGPGASLLVDGLFMTLLGTLARIGSDDWGRDGSHRESALGDRQLARVIEYIDAHLSEPTTVEDLAEVAGLSEYHFMRRFKLATNATPHAFVIGRRIEASRQMLSDRSLSIAHVAYECGFSSQSHFTNQFRNTVGVPPGAYRRALSA
ncbi:MAG: AraC family transcriptional regulator [Pseudomonadota bacterium]